MKMTPLILLILGLSGMYCDSHFLRYYYTVVSSMESGMPVFSFATYVDDQEISSYNSDTRQRVPKIERLKKLENEYWTSSTQRCWSLEAVSKHDVQTLISQFNQTRGFHFLQWSSGCELRDDGTTVGYSHYAYDGRDFMYLDAQRGIWIPIITEAHLTAQKWNSPEQRRGKMHKNFLENRCLEELKKFINNSREVLEKRVYPEVKAWRSPQSDGVTRLHCLVYGFHPRAVDVKWMRNGVDHIPSDEMSPILPHPDGTYQIRVSVEVPAGEEDTFSCHVEHSSLENKLVVNLDPDNGLFIPVIAGIAGVVIILITAVGLFYFYSKRGRGYKSTSSKYCIMFSSLYY
uniref:Ig-like domain-containing protein n=1 Tax=Pyxicephalus adspersus TaxID=30357 RepID=A0AAV3A253_PYXAD|nr:TPA: hypothetical protein GDO54_017247 [Pyxicephalus adspersus]